MTATYGKLMACLDQHVARYRLIDHPPEEQTHRLIQGGWAAMNTNAYSEPVLWRKSPVPHHATWCSSVKAEATIEFGCFRMLKHEFNGTRRGGFGRHRCKRM